MLTQEWISLYLSIALVLIYEIRLRVREQHAPDQVSRTAHTLLRQQWARAVMEQHGSETLAVETLRNSMMSATITASTAALAMMGLITLTGDLFGQQVLTSHAGGLATPPIKQILLLLLISSLFCSFVCSAVAVRFYNHVGYMIAMPVNMPMRNSWIEPASDYIGRAGELYSMSLRLFFCIAPLLFGLVNPMALMPATALMVLLLRWFDRVPVGKFI